MVYTPNCQLCPYPCFDFEETGYCKYDCDCCPMFDDDDMHNDGECGLLTED